LDEKPREAYTAKIEELDKRLGDLKEEVYRSKSKSQQLSSLILDHNERPPARFLPRTFYFENSYLGGNAAYLERLSRLARDFPKERPYLQALLPEQPLDPPSKAGLSLSLSLDRSWIDKPGRLLLQVGLQGSKRFGWRRPPLDLILYLDGLSKAQSLRAARAFLKGLEPQDRLGLVQGAQRLIPLSKPDDFRLALIRQTLQHQPEIPARDLTAQLLSAAAEFDRDGAQHRIPGSRSLIILSESEDERRVSSAERAAHALNLRGVVSSVIALNQLPWWSVAGAGYGNFHQANHPEALEGVVEAELQSLARVIARLLRVNIRLAPDVEGIRVLGSRVLEEEQVRKVKAREKATDEHLSRSMGLKADRGEDDNGIQSVIPYFYGGDSHIILVELWAQRAGPIADVSLRYKDMVRMNNASLHSSISLSSLPRRESVREQNVKQNARGFRLAEQLQRLARDLRRGSRGRVQRSITKLLPSCSSKDRQLLEGLRDLLKADLHNATLAEALELAALRRIGTSH